MLRLAFRNLFRSKVRLAMSVGGVALALMRVLALDASMTGAERQLTAYIDNSGADVWVAQSGVRNLHMVSSWVPSSATDEVEDVPGVESVTPIMYLTGPLDTGEELNLAYVIGVPEDAGMGKPWRVAEGKSVPEPGEAVIDSGAAERSGLKLGDEVKILGQELKVAGLSGGTTTLTNSIAFISMLDFGRVRGGGRVVSFVLAKAEQGETPEAVAGRIEEDVGGVTAQSRAEFAEQERRLVKDMASDVLTIMNLAGFLTGLAVVALTVYTATLARRSEYGVLKALGARNGRLYGVVLAQALYSVALGFVLELAFTLLLSAAVPSLASNLTLQVSGASLLKVGIVSLLIAGLAAILPIRQFAGPDPATVFRGSEMDDSTLRVEHVTKRFGSGETEVVAVRDVSSSVALGEVVLIMGPSGSGKTTFLSMLGALRKPTEGEIRLNGEVLSALKESRLPAIRLRHFGFIFQDFNLLSALTVLENVAIVSQLAGVNKKAAREKAGAVLTELGLGERLNFLPGTGERYDVLVDAANPGVWQLAAQAEGTGKQARAVFRYRGRKAHRPMLTRSRPNSAARCSRTARLRLHRRQKRRRAAVRTGWCPSPSTATTRPTCGL